MGYLCRGAGSGPVFLRFTFTFSPAPSDRERRSVSSGRRPIALSSEGGSLRESRYGPAAAHYSP
jgi:hypothetical protein